MGPASQLPTRPLEKMAMGRTLPQKEAGPSRGVLRGFPDQTGVPPWEDRTWVPPDTPGGEGRGQQRQVT